MARLLALVLAAFLLAACSAVSPGGIRSGGTPTPGGPPVDPVVRSDADVLFAFADENEAPWSAFVTSDDGFHITSYRPDAALEARARELVSTSLIFEYRAGDGRAIPSSPLPHDPSLLPVPATALPNSCSLMSPTVEGTLVADERFVLALRPDPGQPWAGETLKLYWFEGWSARREGSRLALLAPMRDVVAYEGEAVEVQGTELGGDGFHACQFRRR